MLSTKGIFLGIISVKPFSVFNDPVNDDCVEVMINGVVVVEDDCVVISRVIVVLEGIVVVDVEEKVVVDVTVVVKCVDVVDVAVRIVVFFFRLF